MEHLEYKQVIINDIIIKKINIFFIKRGYCNEYRAFKGNRITSSADD